jgi:hypothetical protein
MHLARLRGHGQGQHARVKLTLGTDTLVAAGGGTDNSEEAR